MDAERSWSLSFVEEGDNVKGLVLFGEDELAN